ncbi:MAG: family sodium-coupled anion symporter [Chitinophagaceae bacterium]|nr:family sodium-coupled anion symporter [Chitinophagaceae bacterium]
MQSSPKRILALLAGPLLFALVILLEPFGLSGKQALVLAIAVWMVTWWITEALPMPVVALMPIILFPLMGVATTKAVAAPYANEVIFLFMGGFMIGLAIEKWNLHKRIALTIVNLTGTSGNRIVLGFILSTGLISMWLSNTATTMMMYPIAMSVITVMEGNDNTKGNLSNLSVCLLLAIAYASNFGGLATIIGTPPNVQFKMFLQKTQGYDFSFADWMKLCLPLSLVLLLCLYFVMVKWLYPNNIRSSASAREHVLSELRKLGKLSTPEARVLVVFATTALLWINRGIINELQQRIILDDTIIAVMGAVLLFVLPSGTAKSKALLEWSDTKNMAWGILLLFGGGISMADQLEKAGLIQMLGDWMGGIGTGGLFLVFIVALVSIFISEVMSNVAQVIVFAPVIAAMAAGMNIDLLPVGMAMTLGASCAGMLPMGTPPNAIVFASGKLKLKHMTSTGFVMNMISAVLISLFCWYLLPLFVKAIH